MLDALATTILQEVRHVNIIDLHGEAQWTHGWSYRLPSCFRSIEDVTRFADVAGRTQL
jgi:hypothetical protein